MEFFEIKIADSFSADSVDYIQNNEWTDDGKKIGLCVLQDGRWQNYTPATGTCNFTSKFKNVNTNKFTAVKKMR